MTAVRPALRIALLLALLLPSSVRADDTEAEAAKIVSRFANKVKRDAAAQGKPIIALDFLLSNRFKPNLTPTYLAELRKLKSLKSLSLRGAADATLTMLGEIHSLTELHIAGTEVTNAGMKELRQLHNLEVLDVGNTKVTGNGLKMLRDLKHLHTVFLLPSSIMRRAGAGIGDADLDGIGELKSLRKLVLDESAVTDAGLKRLQENKNLEELYLQHTQITGSGLNDLGRLPKLRKLLLYETKVTDAGVKALRDLQALEILDLGRTQVTETAMKDVGKFKSLNTLHLHGVPLSAAGLKDLRTLPNLQELHVGPLVLTEELCVALRGLKTLVRITLSLDKIPDAGFQGLKGMKNFRFLGNDEPPTDAVLKIYRESGLLHALPEAQTESRKRAAGPLDVFRVNLRYASVTEVGLRELAEFKNLRSLVIKRECVTDAVLKTLREIGLLHALNLDQIDNMTWPANAAEVTRLDLRGTKVTPAGLLELRDHKNLIEFSSSGTGDIDATIKNLRQIGLLHLLGRIDFANKRRPTCSAEVKLVNSQGPGLSDAGVKDLVTEFKNLEVLFLDKTRVTDACLKDMRDLKNLKTLILADTRVTDAGLKDLGAIMTLQEIALSNTSVTDAGLKELHGLKNLKSLGLPGTKVTSAGRQVLQQALPGLTIHWLPPPKFKSNP